ncbi:MAG TPA: MMPL family transporter [Actinomycetota bacterium]|nr:MMPL family transporter [Actinomycetota bacterium]
MLRPLARFVSRYAVPVILAWGVLAGALFLLAPPLDEVLTQDIAAFLSDDAPSVVAAEEVGEAWPGEELQNFAAIVFRREEGLTSRDVRYLRGVERWVRSDEAPPNVRTTQSPYSAPEFAEAFRSEDGRVEIVGVSFTTPPFQPDTNEAVEAIRGRAQSSPPAGLAVHVTGNAGVAADQASAIETSVHRTTLITLFLVTAILVWVYRSPIAPAIPLMTIALAFLVSRGVVALLGAAGMAVSSLVEQLLVVIVFGAGTDYCLFVVSRYKEELTGRALEPEERRRTLVGTMVVIGGLIASSAATTVVGFASQSAAEFGMYRTTGPAIAVAVIITLVAGLTLVPALLSLLGRWAFWPWRASGSAPTLMTGEART